RAHAVTPDPHRRSRRLPRLRAALGVLALHGAKPARARRSRRSVADQVPHRRRSRTRARNSRPAEWPDGTGRARRPDSMEGEAIMKRTVLAVSLLTLAHDAWATAPTSFTFQGVLRNNMGQLQSLTVTGSLNLWNAQTGGSMLGPSHTFAAVAQNGLFTVTVSDA